MAGHWKFDRYEIKNGYIIPARGATLAEFDPWGQYEQARRAGGVKPYEDLLRAVASINEIDARIKRERGITPEVEVSMLLAGTDEIPAEVDAEAAAKAAAWCGKYGVLGVGLEDQSALSPLRLGLLRHYREAVTDWLSAARDLCECIESRDCAGINRYLKGACTAIEEHGMGLRLVPRSSSLLSALALMAAQDLAGGSRVLRCSACGAPFVTSAYQAKYCSVQCQWRALKSRARKKQRA